MSAVPKRSADELFERIASIVEAARGHVARSVNTAMVHAYWHIGREIIEVEQQGEERAGYGEGVLRDLAVRLVQRFGRGFAEPNLRNMRQFYLTSSWRRNDETKAQGHPGPRAKRPRRGA